MLTSNLSTLKIFYSLFLGIGRGRGTILCNFYCVLIIVTFSHDVTYISSLILHSVFQASGEDAEQVEMDVEEEEEEELYQPYQQEQEKEKADSDMVRSFYYGVLQVFWSPTTVPFEIPHLGNILLDQFTHYLMH